MDVYALVFLILDDGGGGGGGGGSGGGVRDPILFSPVLGAADWRKRERERVATETKNKFLCARRRAHKTATSSSEKLRASVCLR